MPCKAFGGAASVLTDQDDYFTVVSAFPKVFAIQGNSAAIASHRVEDLFVGVSSSRLVERRDISRTRTAAKFFHVLAHYQGAYQMLAAGEIAAQADKRSIAAIIFAD